MDPQKIQQLISQNRQDLTQRMAQMPSNIAPPNFAKDDQIVARQREKEQKIMEMYEHDRRLADTYANPQNEMYLEDPYAREKARSMQSQASAAEILNINRAMQEREATLTADYERAMKEQEMAFKLKELEGRLLQNELENALKIQQLAAEKSEGAALPNLLQGLTQIKDTQNKVATAKPIATLKTGVLAQKPSLKDFKVVNGVKQPKNASAAALLSLQKQYPGAEIRWSQNKDGTYTYSVVGSGTPFATQEEVAVSKDPQSFAQQMLATTIAAKPQYAPQAQLLVEQSGLNKPKEEKFGYSIDESAAGVAGQPINEQTLAMWKNYAQDKQQQIITTPGGPFGIGKQQLMVNKKTGETSPIDTGNMFTDVFGGIGDFFANNIFGNMYKPTNAARPSLSNFDK